MNELHTLLAILNAALEHVPANTRQIFAGTAQPAVKALEEKLAKYEQPPNG